MSKLKRNATKTITKTKMTLKTKKNTACEAELHQQVSKSTEHSQLVKLTLKSGKDQADKRTVHDTSHEIRLAPEVHKASDRNQGNLCTQN